MNPREYAALFEVEDKHWWFVGLRREIARELARVPVGFRRWLDAGSGSGGLLANLQAPGRPAGIGLEVAWEGLRFCRKRALSRVALGSVECLPFASESFDLVTSVDVLCHRGVEESLALSEAQRCLRQGGMLVLQVPAFNFLRGEHDAAVWTNRRYRLSEVERLLAQAGFVVRRSFYRNSILFPAAALRRLLHRGVAAEEQARSDVAPVGRALDRLFSTILRIEEALRSAGWRFPFGLSIFCLAQKPPQSHRG